VNCSDALSTMLCGTVVCLPISEEGKRKELSTVKHSKQQ
jgi:hypothetical protein